MGSVASWGDRDADANADDDFLAIEIEGRADRVYDPGGKRLFQRARSGCLAGWQIHRHRAAPRYRIPNAPTQARCDLLQKFVAERMSEVSLTSLK